MIILIRGVPVYYRGNKVVPGQAEVSIGMELLEEGELRYRLTNSRALYEEGEMRCTTVEPL